MEETIPPITTVARGRWTSAPVPVAMASRVVRISNWSDAACPAHSTATLKALGAWFPVLFLLIACLAIFPAYIISQRTRV